MSAEMHSEWLGVEGSLHAELVRVIKVDCAEKKNWGPCRAPSSQYLKDWEVKKKKKYPLSQYQSAGE